MRAPSACATASGGVFTPRATWRRRESITRSVPVPSVVAMAPSSPSACQFANGLLVGLFLRRGLPGELELAGRDLLRVEDCLLRGLRRIGLAAAGEDDAERDRSTLLRLRPAEVCLLAQLVDEVARAVVALGGQALLELPTGVVRGVHGLPAAAAARAEREDEHEQSGTEYPGSHRVSRLPAHPVRTATGASCERLSTKDRAEAGAMPCRHTIDIRRYSSSMSIVWHGAPGAHLMRLFALPAGDCDEPASPRGARPRRGGRGRPSCGRSSPSTGRLSRSRSCRPGSGGACAARAASDRSAFSAGGGEARNGSCRRSGSRPGSRRRRAMRRACR